MLDQLLKVLSAGAVYASVGHLVQTAPNVPDPMLSSLAFSIVSCCRYVLHRPTSQFCALNYMLGCAHTKHCSPPLSIMYDFTNISLGVHG